jgi:YD repeat-containing protein
MPIIARDTTGEDHSVRCDDDGHLIVQFIAKYEIRWETKVDFDKGTY